MIEDKNKSKLPKPLTPVEMVKDIQSEIDVLSKELTAISYLPDEFKKMISNATELVRDRIRALHNKQCAILSKKVLDRKNKE